VSTRVPELFTLLHSFQLNLLHLLPIHIKMDLPTERKEFFSPFSADEIFDCKADGSRFGFLPSNIPSFNQKGHEAIRVEEAQSNQKKC
jgi:hypothetical protein